MIKKASTFILCGMMLLCFIACNNNTTVNNTSTKDPSSNETTIMLEESKTTSKHDENENTPVAVFNTENVSRITFYAYYGEGKGSDVPNEYITEITNWLNSFTIGEIAPELLPPGTNTYYVEIEYLDGTVTKKGLDVITVDGTAYFLKSDKQPDCFTEILSKTSLE